MRTLGDLINNLLRCSLADVVHDNICAPRSEEQRVTVYEVITRSAPEIEVYAHALPRPPPAPVTMTVWPLKDS